MSEFDLLLKEEYPPDPSARMLLSRRQRREQAKAKGAVAAELMSRPGGCTPERVKRLPVTDLEGRLVGIVSRADLLKAFLRADEELRREIVEDMLDGELLMGPDRVDVTVRDGVVVRAVWGVEGWSRWRTGSASRSTTSPPCRRSSPRSCCSDQTGPPATRAVLLRGARAGATSGDDQDRSDPGRRPGCPRRLCPAGAGRRAHHRSTRWDRATSWATTGGDQPAHGRRGWPAHASRWWRTADLTHGGMPYGAGAGQLR